jgi:hypothetical protein
MLLDNPVKVAFLHGVFHYSPEHSQPHRNFAKPGTVLLILNLKNSRNILSLRKKN